MHRLAAIGIIGVLLASACGGTNTEVRGEVPISTSSTTTSDAPAPTASSSTDPLSADRSWEKFLPEDCKCADGSDYAYWLVQGDPQRVLVYLDSGGACFSAETCGPDDPTYSRSILERSDLPDKGLFQLDNPENPVADWSVVYIPYCTGDVHVGTRRGVDYGDGVVMDHTGFLNAQNGLETLASRFPDAEQILVAGSSAGAVATPLFAGLVADDFPNADVMSLPDGGGGFPSNPILNEQIGNLWGTAAVIPDWESTAGLTVAEFGIPDVVALAAANHPNIRWARYDNAFDGVQARYLRLAGFPDQPIKEVLDNNEALAENQGVDYDVYVAPGVDHVILDSENMYGITVNEVRFVDWLAAFVAGEEIDDVVCIDCEPPN